MEHILMVRNLQNSFEKKLGHTDASYTAADNGTYTNLRRTARAGDFHIEENPLF